MVTENVEQLVERIGYTCIEEKSKQLSVNIYLTVIVFALIINAGRRSCFF